MAYVRIDSIPSVFTVDGTSRFSVSVTAVDYTGSSPLFRGEITMGGYSCREEILYTNPNNVKLKPEIQLIQAIPSAQRGKATVTIRMFNVKMQEIGTPATAEIELIFREEDAGPLVQDGCITARPVTSGTAIDYLTWDGYVQGYSRAGITFLKEKMNAQYGAAIEKCSVVMQGRTYDHHSETGDDYYALTGQITTAGDIALKCTITDSRGFAYTQTLSISVYAYYKPRLSGISVYRANADDTQDDFGNYIYVKADIDFASVGGQNSLKNAYVDFSQVNGANLSRTNITSGTRVLLGEGAVSPVNSYLVSIFVQDQVNSIGTYTQIVPTMAVAFNIMEGGGGAAFGRLAGKTGVLDSAWAIHSDMDIDALGSITSGASLNGEILNVSRIKAMLTAAIQIDSAVDFNRKLYPYGGIYGVTDYVGYPMETYGTWIDGKKIYRNVVEFNVTTTGSAVTAAHIDDFETLITLRGYAYRTATEKYLPINFYYSDTNYCSTHISSAGDIIVRMSQACRCVAIVEYTTISDGIIDGEPPEVNG